jgi:hypothetical protein
MKAYSSPLQELPITITKSAVFYHKYGRATLSVLDLFPSFNYGLEMLSLYLIQNRCIQDLKLLWSSGLHDLQVVQLTGLNHTIFGNNSRD